MALELPNGWRLPTKEELSDEYRQHFKVELVKALADYNGDSKIDTALILVSTQFQGDGLFVHLSNPNGYSWISLNEDNWDVSYPNKNYTYSGPNMGIGALTIEA